MDLDTLLHDTAHAPEVTIHAWRPPAERPRRHRTLLRVSLVAAVAAAALVLPATSLLKGTTPAATASAAEVLHQAAVAAGAQPDGGWRNAKYWYSKSTYSRGGQTRTREIWIGHHDPGVLLDPGVSDRPLPVGVAAFDNGDWDSLWSLPTDPDKLAALFRSASRGSGPSPDSELFTWVGDYLRESPAPPKLRAALYEVAARIPGVKLLGPTTDSVGRPGVGISRDGEKLIIDPHTGALLADDEGRGFTATYLDQHATDTAPTAPGAAADPTPYAVPVRPHRVLPTTTPRLGG